MAIRQFVTFRLAGYLFGIDVLDVREINRVLDTTPVPPAPDYVRGLINLRGQVITVMDLGVRLGLGPIDITPDAHNVILKGDRLGFLVEAIEEVEQADESIVESPPANLGGIEGELVAGVIKLAGELLVLLDAKKLLEPYPAAV